MAEVPTYPIVLQDGDSLSLSWQWRDTDGPKDITGFTAAFAVFNAEGSSVLTLDLSIDGAQGTVTLDATPAQLAALAPETYAYTVVIKSADEAIVKTLTKGPLRVDGLPSP